MAILSYHWAEKPLHKLYGEAPWFGGTLAYVLDRVRFLERRLETTFRYVTCDADNALTYSYEFSSIVRDAGSVFDSMMRALLREAGAEPQSGSTFSIVDYRYWLLEKVPLITELSMECETFQEKRFIIPFSRIHSASPEWWMAYNKVKHSDMDEFKSGNLKNAVGAVGACAGLFALMYGGNPSNFLSFFHDFGTRAPQADLIGRLLFEC